MMALVECYFALEIQVGRDMAKNVASCSRLPWHLSAA